MNNRNTPRTRAQQTARAIQIRIARLFALDSSSWSDADRAELQGYLAIHGSIPDNRWDRSNRVIRERIPTKVSRALSARQFPCIPAAERVS